MGSFSNSYLLLNLPLGYYQYFVKLKCRLSCMYTYLHEKRTSKESRTNQHKLWSATTHEASTGLIGSPPQQSIRLHSGLSDVARHELGGGIKPPIQKYSPQTKKSPLASVAATKLSSIFEKFHAKVSGKFWHESLQHFEETFA